MNNELFASLVSISGYEFVLLIMLGMIAGTVNMLISSMLLWSLEDLGARISWLRTLVVMLGPALALAVLASDPRDRVVGTSTFLGSAVWVLVFARVCYKQSRQKRRKKLVAGDVF